MQYFEKLITKVNDAIGPPQDAPEATVVDSDTPVIPPKQQITILDVGTNAQVSVYTKTLSRRVTSNNKQKGEENEENDNLSSDEDEVDAFTEADFNGIINSSDDDNEKDQNEYRKDKATADMVYRLYSYDNSDNDGSESEKSSSSDDNESLELGEESSGTEEYVTVNDTIVHKTDVMNTIIKKSAVKDTSVAQKSQDVSISKLDEDLCRICRSKPKLFGSAKRMSSYFVRPSETKIVKLPLRINNTELIFDVDKTYYKAKILDCVNTNLNSSKIVTAIAVNVTLKYVISNYTGSVDLCIDTAKDAWVTFNKNVKYNNSKNNSYSSSKDDSDLENGFEDDEIALAMNITRNLSKTYYNPRCISLYKESRLWLMYVVSMNASNLDHIKVNTGQTNKEGETLFLLPKTMFTSSLIAVGSKKDSRLNDIKSRCMLLKSDTHIKVSQSDLDDFTKVIQSNPLCPLDKMYLCIRPFDGNPFSQDVYFTMDFVLEYITY